MPKISQVLNSATETLRKANINSAGLDAEILILSAVATTVSPKGSPVAMADKLNKSFLYTHPEFELSDAQEKKYKRFISRRSKNEPVAYILGHKEFFGLDFLVDKNVLVPRPETELMAEEVIKLVTRDKRQETSNKILFIDIGTGSGCVPIAVLNELRIKNYELSIKTIATDVSAAALKVAQKNARRHGLTKKIKFIKGDLLNFFCHPGPRPGLPAGEAGIQEPFSLDSRFRGNDMRVIITANLPYLPNKIYRQNYQGLKFEPCLALLAKNNGLALYEKLLKQVAGYPPLSKGRRGGVVIKNSDNHSALDCCRGTPPSKGGDKSQTTILLELLPFQKPALTRLIKKHLPKADVKFKKDLAGKWRMAVITI
jgi:release factor glutamine methyltransferase